MRLLVADDQKDVLAALKLLLGGAGYEVDTSASHGGVLSAVEKADYEAAHHFVLGSRGLRRVL